MATIAFVAVKKLEYSASTALANRTAIVLASVINQARVSYSANAVAKIKSHPDILVQANYHNKRLTIPNPATFAIELGQVISNPQEGFILSTYSKYPFSGRKDSGGPQDSFQLDALSHLSSTVKVFERVEVLNDISVLRHAEAIFMKQSCVDCHNRHSSSPKKDWRIGDVRGAIDITIPLNNGTEALATTVHYAYVIFMSFSVIGLLSMYVTLKRAQGASKELERKVQKRTFALNQMARTDALTKIANRRYFDEFSFELIDESAAMFPVAVIIYDVDHFKKVNDNYGHDIGDKCLIAIVKAVSLALRQKSDFHARIGGEEFAIILQSISIDELEKIIARILQNIRAVRILDNDSLRLTCSIGSSFITSFESSTSKDILKLADSALYEAKNNGRDQWVHKTHND
jgi:diguanylate cyclase (GGDEF)-like protein